MPNILVRDIDEVVVERLKLRARAAGRSMNSYVKEVLERQAAPLPRHEALALTDHLRAMTPRTVDAPAPAELLRPLRDGEDQRL
jgi:antitoxin FitA